MLYIFSSKRYSALIQVQLTLLYIFSSINTVIQIRVLKFAFTLLVSDSNLPPRCGSGPTPTRLRGRCKTGTWARSTCCSVGGSIQGRFRCKGELHHGFFRSVNSTNSADRAPECMKRDPNSKTTRRTKAIMRLARSDGPSVHIV